MADNALRVVLAERKEAMLEELKLVHEAINQAKGNPDRNADWIAKLEDWHGELQSLIEDIPKNG